jgi:type IV secretory pathway VirB4 component
MPPNNQFPNPSTNGAISGAPQPSPSQQPVFSQPAPTNEQNSVKPKNPNSTQNTLLLSEVRDNMVIMADGSFRAVIACKSINFDLMSSREREGVEYSYQNFLNSLNHPVQVIIRSQRIDIGPYIDKLIQIRQSQDNMLLNVLMDDYINFIDILAQEANIMDKSFFIAIPYYPSGDLSNLVEKSKGFFDKLFARPQNVVTKIDAATYEKAKTEIKNRVDGVMAGLFQMGIQSVQLNTKELGELYYNFYNPDTAVRQPLGDFTNITTTFVKKGEGSAPIYNKGNL